MTACVSWLARVGRAGRMRACAVCRPHRAWSRGGGAGGRRLADARGSMAHALRLLLCCLLPVLRARGRGASLSSLTSSHWPGRQGRGQVFHAVQARRTAGQHPRGKTSWYGYACATRPPRFCPAHRSSDRIRRTVTVTVSLLSAQSGWLRALPPAAVGEESSCSRDPCK